MKGGKAYRGIEFAKGASGSVGIQIGLGGHKTLMLS